MRTATADSGLSKYHLGPLLGSGGMGSVYLAHDLTLNRDVAIKFISAEKISDAGARRRLTLEARAAAALEHPNICAVHEIGVASDGAPYIVMQYVPGETLADALIHGPLEIRQALMITARIADALAAAHKRGIIHRDLKPQNIILTPDGSPKLVDFGIAHCAISGPADETHTVTVETGGTPGYMSPEQVQQRPVDGRSDLFSLGAVLFECLTGRTAFGGRNGMEIGGRVLYEHPPAPSSLRPELTERHDELCRQLLAKEPDERFQSAGELLGALRVLLADGHRSTTRENAPVPQGTSPREEPAVRAARLFRWKAVAPTAAAFALVAALALWNSFWTRPLPTPTPQAERWYQRGTEFIREGAYYSGRRALEEAVRLFPEYAQAYARLAEAHSALDEQREAERELVRATAAVPDQSRLPVDDRLRLDAIRAVVLHNTKTAVDAYTSLANRHARDARVWVDLGRAQDMEGFRTDARRSFERAIELDPQYAAARLRLAAVDSKEGNRERALNGFTEAERLYHASSDLEGEAETLLQRTAFLDGIDEIRDARAALDKAMALAARLESPFYLIRARLVSSSVTASEGHFAESERIAVDAVKRAQDAGLDSVAAGGLIDLGFTLQNRKHYQEARVPLERAIQLADTRGAQFTAVRARLQYASLKLDLNDAAGALALAEPTLDYVRSHHEVRREITAMSIISRALGDQGKYEQAREMSHQVLRMAEAIKDEAQVAVLLENLASQATARGLLPEALRLRERAEEIHRRLQTTALPYDLTNRAELLIRLGRGVIAASVFAELERGITDNPEAYAGRAPRAKVLAALQAAITGRFGDVISVGGRMIADSPNPSDGNTLLAKALVEYGEVRLGRTSRDNLFPAEAAARLQPLPAREVHFWHSAARLAANDTAAALTDVRTALRDLGRWPSDEVEWRIAAVGTAAAQRAGATVEARELSARAAAALQRLRASWKEQAADYERRPDLVELRAMAGLNVGLSSEEKRR